MPNALLPCCAGLTRSSSLPARTSESFHCPCWILYVSPLYLNYVITELISPRCNKSQGSVLFAQSPPYTRWFMQLSSRSAPWWNGHLTISQRALMLPWSERLASCFLVHLEKINENSYWEGGKHNILFCWQRVHTIKVSFFNKNQWWLKTHNKCHNINKRCYT